MRRPSRHSCTGVSASAAGPQHTRRERNTKKRLAMTRLFYREKLNKEPMGREYESFMDRIDMITATRCHRKKVPTRGWPCAPTFATRLSALGKKPSSWQGSPDQCSTSPYAGPGRAPAGRSGAPFAAKTRPQRPSRTSSPQRPAAPLLSDPDRTSPSATQAALSPPAAKRKRLINWTEMVSEDSTLKKRARPRPPGSACRLTPQTQGWRRWRGQIPPQAPPWPPRA